MTRAQTIRDLIVDEARSAEFRAHGLHVRIGDDVAEHRWIDDEREDIHSAAKGICVLAAGMAADEGLIDLHAPLRDLLAGVPFGSGADGITMRDLLTMSSGIDLPWSDTMMTDWPDLALEFLRRPRGEGFQYSNASTYTAMMVLAARVGDIVEFLRPRLFEPLRIEDIRWDRCPNGRILAGGGLHLRTEELARIGNLIRDRGLWEGRRLISAGWIDAMHTSWVATGMGPAYERYALSGWDGPGDAWRLHGAGGQLVIFGGDGVVTLTADDHFKADAMAAFVVETLHG